MELLVAPPPTAPTRFADSNPTTCPPPNHHHHHHHLRLPFLRNPNPKHNLSLFPPHTPSPSLTPQPTPCRDNYYYYDNNNHNMKKKKKRKRKGATTSHILHLMDALPFPIPIDIYTSLIKECTLSPDPQTAIELHTHIAHSGIKPPLSFINRILVMFVSCGLLDYACQLFDAMPVKDFNSWATLFIAYYDNADYEEAIDVFLAMLHQLGMSEFPPWICACLLKACACIENIPLGMQVHGWLLKLGTCDHVLLSSSLIRFYGRFTCVKDANAVFNKLSRHNTSTWTAKIVSGCREMDFPEVFNDFKEMGRQGIKKDTYTFSSVLKACGKMMDHGRCGEQVHADAMKLGLASDNYVQCSLIAMYGRSGLLRDAKQVFETSRSERNVDSWNAMLMGYLENGLYIEAVKFLYQMKAAGLKPHESLLDKVRIACGSVTYSSTN